MKTIITETISGRVSVPVYYYSEIPYTQIMLSAQESKDRQGISYLEIPCAFDIETTNIFERAYDKKGRYKVDTSQRKPFAFMYHWQFCIGYRVVFGRTWKEFQKMLRLIEKNMNLSKKLRLVVYVHHLPFEMEFMRKFLRVTDSFCKAERKPLYIVHNGTIEFRCSAALSNMNLTMFCKNENARFYKLTDTFDYSKIRTSATQLTPEEESYCYNDVRGLCECIQSLMRVDTLATMPLTNTGYVRRDARNAMRKNKRNRHLFKNSSLLPEEYEIMRHAFRGGDTHANARYANQIIKNVTSFDIASSYPACMMMGKYPIGKFTRISLQTYNELSDEDPDRYCFVLHIALTECYCKADHGMPYIPFSKTKYCSTDKVLDNGRIKCAGLLTMWVTDIDFDIILKEYGYRKIQINEIYFTMAGQLPDEYKNVVLDYFQKKTTLKGLDDPESVYMYNRSKNRLNALYGLMAMAPDKQLITYTGKGDTGYQILKVKTLEEILVKYYKSRNNFLPYQWALYVTASARKRLHDMCAIIGRDCCYVDTDSVKFVNYEKHKKAITTLNEKLQLEAERAGAFAEDRAGKRHYMGVWEYDGSYNSFKTLGAKKYVVDVEGTYYSTIAGVSKKAGQKYLNKHGLDGFAIGKVIPDSGHLIAFYNDDEIHEIEIDGVKMQTASNVALIDDSYTIGISDGYEQILRDLGLY